MANHPQCIYVLRCVALLNQLQSLISDGNDESGEADRLREQMDERWLRLTDDEIAENDATATKGGLFSLPWTERENCRGI